MSYQHPATLCKLLNKKPPSQKVAFCLNSEKQKTTAQPAKNMYIRLGEISLY